MQSQNNNITGDLPEITLSDKVWQFVRFFVITGLIFTASFLVINFHAYKSILASAFDPEAQEAKQQILSEVVGEGNGSEESLPILKNEKAAQKSFAWLDFPVVPSDNRLVVPKLGISAPLVAMTTEHIEGENWTELEKSIQDSLRDGVVHYPGTASPGEVGNVFITGHSSYYPWDKGNFKDVFALLGQLEVGDEYHVYYNQKQYTYVVRKKFEVNPDNVDVLMQPHDKKMSTLMTCTPVGTALRRLIVQAEQI